MSDKEKKEKKESPVWGDTDTRRYFKAKVSMENLASLQGMSIVKGIIYRIPENKASRDYFDLDPFPATATKVAKAASGKPKTTKKQKGGTDDG